MVLPVVLPVLSCRAGPSDAFSWLWQTMVVRVTMRVRFSSNLASVGRSQRLVTLELPLSRLSFTTAAPRPDAVAATRRASRADGQARRLVEQSGDTYGASTTIVVVGDDSEDAGSDSGDVFAGGAASVAGVGVGLLVLGVLVGYVVQRRSARERHQFILQSASSVQLESPKLGSSASLHLGRDGDGLDATAATSTNA